MKLDNIAVDVKILFVVYVWKHVSMVSPIHFECFQVIFCISKVM